MGRKCLWTCTLLGLITSVILQTCAGLSITNQSATLRYYYKTNISLQNFKAVLLSEGETLLDEPSFDSSLDSWFYVHGYLASPSGTISSYVLAAALKQTYINVFCLNWEKEASAPTSNQYIKQAAYPSAIARMKLVAAEFANTLCEMKLKGLNLSRVHLVGHSLGAQLTAQTAREMRNNQNCNVGANKEYVKIGRITGLDAAGPFFGEGNLSVPTLNANDSDFTMCIHTDYSDGGYGIKVTGCHIDLFVNYANLTVSDKEKQVQPGCPVGSYDKFSDADLCSHNFACKLWVEFITKNASCIASKGNSYAEWAAGSGRTSEKVYLGDFMDRTQTGTYYMVTNCTGIEIRDDYCIGLRGLYPHQETCVYDN